MESFNPGRSFRWALAAASVAATFSLAAPLGAEQTTMPAQWQEHKGDIFYFGITSNYSCSGIEGKVKQILLALGARKDVSVNANGCGLHDMPMGHSLTVSVRVFSLAPVSSTDTAPGAAAPVQASWAPVDITGQHPSFMGDGDCELIDQMHDFITKNFSEQNVNYHTACVPHDSSAFSFAIHGEFLKNTNS